MSRFLTNSQVEARAEMQIAKYEARFGLISTPPVPMERVVEEVFDLRILWEPIEGAGALSPLAGLRPAERQIVINETRREALETTPGLLGFTLGHELGHWDLHVDHAGLAHPSFEGFEGEETGAFQHFRSSGGDVRVLLGRLHRIGLTTTEAYEAVREMTRGEDSFFEARQADRYAATLLMPEALVRRAIRGVDLLQWPSLYRLRDLFEVSISALTIRLQTLGMIYIAKDKRIHRSREEASGQTALW